MRTLPPPRRSVAEGLKTEGNAAYKQGDYEQATQLFTRAIGTELSAPRELAPIGNERRASHMSERPVSAPPADAGVAQSSPPTT